MRYHKENMDCYDYGARFYDPVLARFIGVDPIVEKFYHVTPYNYAENSPIANIRYNSAAALDIH